MSELNRAKAISAQKINLKSKTLESKSIDDYVIDIIKANLLCTMHIKHELGTTYIITDYLNETKVKKFSMSPEEYLDFCHIVFNLDPEELYNCARSLNIDGVKTRVHANMPPFTTHPILTISTTKQPPTELTQKTIPDEAWDKIVHSNFIIAGPSGSGKTYLMNYLLNKFIKKDECIALVQEFDEIIQPNELTLSIQVPPPKPGEMHLLRYATQEANLMRLAMTCVGEVKGGEAWPLIVQGASGTRIACTCHGKDTYQALARVRALCQLEVDNVDVIENLMSKSIEYIIIMNNKKIMQIDKLKGTVHQGIFQKEEIYS